MVTRSPPDSFAERYPDLAEWVQAGWIESGPTDLERLDDAHTGKVVWETEAECALAAWRKDKPELPSR